MTRICLLLWAALSATASSAGTPDRPDAPLPATRRQDVADTLHGQTVPDPFRWLEDEGAKEVKDWAKAEDDHARRQLLQLPRREELAKRFKDLLYVESYTTPVKRGGRRFYLKQLPDQEKAILFMRQGDGPEKAVLDPNTWSTDGSVSLGRWSPSWNGKWVAFQYKANNSDEAVLRVADVDGGKLTPLQIEGAKYGSAQWARDNSSFYYEWIPPLSEKVTIADRPGFIELRLHKLGTDPAKDAVVHEHLGNPSTFLSGDLSEDGKFLFASISRGWSENDVYVRQLGKDKAFRLLVEGKNAKYFVEEHQGFLYIFTDSGAPHGQVFRTATSKLDRKAWTLIVPEDPEATLESAEVIGGQLALSYLHKAQSEIRLANLDGKKVRKVSLPAVGVVTELGGLPSDEEAYLAFSSLTTPKEIFKLSVKSGQLTSWAKVAEPIDPAPFLVEQVAYPSKDGTQVSMFIVRRKDVVLDGRTPALLYGYGGFGLPMLPSFNATIYPWLEAGGIYALPQIRGGGEYGQKWHDDGRLARKQNVFDDFAAAAEYLIGHKYTQPSRLAIMGGSNGGLLVGATVTQRPELFGAVVCRVPLLDMVRYTKFGSGKTWIHEYGDPEQEADFKVLYAYSPYHRLDRGKKYPPLLMLSADHDDRVDPMHARKFVAALQQMGQPALLRVEANAGHGGADVLKKTVDVNSDMYAWLLRTVGSEPAPSVGGQKPVPTAR